MKNLFLLITVLSGFTVSLFAQTAGTTKTYQMYNTMYVKAKRGQENLLEAAVTAHINKFHATAPHQARFAEITEGTGSDGWYFWSMGPLMYADLDHQPEGNKEHDADWANNVDIHIDQYGESNLWKLQEDLSVTPANYHPDRADVWSMDIKPGMRFQFADLMKKWKAMWEAKKYTYSLRVFYNDLWSSKGNDAVIIYSFDKYADFDDDISWRNDYESIYGAGSWDNFWKSWNECVASTDEHLRKYIK
ncbi:MAG: hypothetical protein WAT91_07625 [Saprospiraceae bacterium]